MLNIVNLPSKNVIFNITKNQYCLKLKVAKDTTKTSSLTAAEKAEKEEVKTGKKGKSGSGSQVAKKVV